jgi:hypothetical protein
MDRVNFIVERAPVWFTLKGLGDNYTDCDTRYKVALRRDPNRNATCEVRKGVRVVSTKLQYTVSRRCFAFLLCSISLLSCRASDDANAAAKQLTTTSTDLASYYDAVSRVVTNDIALGDLQNSLQEVPFAAADRTILRTTSSELQKRADLAKALQGLSSTFSNLTWLYSSA